MRLWLNGYDRAVQLVPLISWVSPANRWDSRFLGPSLRFCGQHLKWVPDIVVGDMGYTDWRQAAQIRQRWGAAVLTKVRRNMVAVAPFELSAKGHARAVCPQGQLLEWLGFEAADQLHWFGVRQEQPLCPWCPEQTDCPRQFCYSPETHEGWFALVPPASRVGKHLLERVRPWIEGSQSYEKNQLGLNQIFYNSLRLTWCVGLLADAVTLLRVHALLSSPPQRSAPMHELTPSQLALELD